MNVSEHLRSMWGEKVRRSTELIVPAITHDGPESSLNNDSWVFDVHYHFRDALDIKYEERRKDKTPYMVWTQGPFLSFKEGDLIQARDGRSAVQVRFANPMGWDPTKGEMYQGSVFYSEYEVSEGVYTKLQERTCSQMQFLQLVIFGKYESELESGSP